ncbi:MAG TPA: hypothetical protein PKC43_08685 [Phycisphaerales bacterium]|nr:hypothetical protein [Phycisphaerales bacterium]HMP37511.1 hypothetical protein [Phycisphaerales bacterium]
MTFVHGPVFDKIEVSLNGLGGAPPGALVKLEDFILQGDFNAMPDGYVIEGMPAIPPEAGDAILMGFTAPAGASFASATLFSGVDEVGFVDGTGKVTDVFGTPIGEFVVWMAEPETVAWKLKVLNRIAAWGAELNNPAGGLAAHAQRMTEHYFHHATLLPTVGTYYLYYNTAVPPGDSPTIRSYFQNKFLVQKPKMLAINPAKTDVVMSGAGDMVSVNGLYTFTVTADAAGVALPVARSIKARFTFVFKESNPGCWNPQNLPWQIIQHHSSKDPINPCPADLNGDGKVDGVDSGILLGSWGNCP